jgi:hypothetical protein
MNKPLTLILCLLAAPIAHGQSMYKCQDIEGGPIRFQQTPCTITGGGEAVPLKAIPSGTGSGLSEQAHQYLGERDQHRAEQAAAAETERQRQEALRVERDKARAAEAQAAAQRETARAIWATGRRY